MRTFLQPLMALAFFGLIRSGDLAITAAMSRSVIRAVLYGIAALFLLLIVVIALFGV